MKVLDEAEQVLEYLAPKLKSRTGVYRTIMDFFYKHDNKPIFFANALMICIWIAGIIGMIIMYVTIELRYKADPKSGSNLFKIIYSICHCVISIILVMYVSVNTHSFDKEPTKTDSSKTSTPDIKVDSNQDSMGGGSVSDCGKKVMDLLLSIPINIRTDVTKFIEKFDTLENVGNTYNSQINLGVMFRLVVAHFPIIIFLIVFTSIVAMIKAYHKILCGNANMSVIIDWPYRIIDIIIYAVFRILGVFIIFYNFFRPNKPVKAPLIMPIFYFTAVYLIIRFILLLYENMFSNTIISLYKWDIRETDCNTNNSDMSGNWILDSNARKEVRARQNSKDSYKLTNDVFSLIFNILIILFLAGISILSVCLLYIYSEHTTLSALLALTTKIGRSTVTAMPIVNVTYSVVKNLTGKKEERPPSEEL
jgi:hypothetical protein